MSTLEVSLVIYLIITYKNDNGILVAIIRKVMILNKVDKI